MTFHIEALSLPTLNIYVQENGGAHAAGKENFKKLLDSLVLNHTSQTFT